MKAEEIGSSPLSRKLLAFLFAEGFSTPTAIDNLGEGGLYREVASFALGITCETVEVWLEHGADTEWLVWAPADAIRPMAEALVASHAAGWWSDAWRERPQVWLSRDRRPPKEAMAGRRVEGKPRTYLWTSSTVEGMVSAWWPIVESGYLGPSQVWWAWSVEMRSNARVFEIRSAEDWQWLCETFPGPELESGLDPDWAAVAEQFDGVHLTVEGLLRSQGVPLARDGRRTMLWSWDAEGTAWLRWSVERATLLGKVDRRSRPNTHRRPRPKSR